MGAQSEARCQKTSSVAGARGIARPRARAADDLSALILFFNPRIISKTKMPIGGSLSLSLSSLKTEREGGFY